MFAYALQRAPLWGRLGKFSMEKLLQFARLAGIDVEIRMKPSSNPGLKVRTKAA